MGKASKLKPSSATHSECRQAASSAFWLLTSDSWLRSSVPGLLTPGLWLTPVVILLTSAFWLLSSARELRAASWRYQIVEVKPQVFIWVPENIRDLEADPEYDRAGTAGFILTNEGVVVVNTTDTPFHAREILYEIRARTDLPVKYVLNTDARPDHFLGNEVFADLKATLISTAGAKAEIERYRRELSKRLDMDERLADKMRAFHPTPPSRTFQGEFTLRVGGREIKLTSVSAGPLAGSAVVYLADARVLFLGDLYENGMIPALDKANLKGWMAFLDTVARWDVDVYVPGHGPPAGKRELGEFRRFLEFLARRPEPKPPEPAPHPKPRG